MAIDAALQSKVSTARFHRRPWDEPDVALIRQRKHQREHKRQRGQYMTPGSLASRIVAGLPLDKCHRILEPSCGDGAFLAAVIDRMGALRHPEVRGKGWELVGIEVDDRLARRARAKTRDCSVASGTTVQVCNVDFFRAYLAGTTRDTQDDTTRLDHGSFDLVVGNPPFGGTFDREIEDVLDRRLGRRIGMKIKKETYAFFIVACVDLLRPQGRLAFVCSDTLLTIPTMAGLRNFLMRRGDVTLTSIDVFSDETSYPTLLLDFVKGGTKGLIVHDKKVTKARSVMATPNLSWGVDAETARFFDGPLLGELFVATSGMTTGNNALFVRKVCDVNRIKEPFEFEFYQAPVTLEYEMDRARLGRLSKKKVAMLLEAERAGETERRVRVLRRSEPVIVSLPDSRYAPYNKANGRIVYSEPTHYIYWENEGEAVLTYKRTGNWYLRGVGGRPHFGKEGISWQLVAAQFVPRYLPTGYILDSGAPCAFLRGGEDREELYFVLGWLLSETANRILKTVVNHTRNIQSKDFERMPYPWWVDGAGRAKVVEGVRAMVSDARRGRAWRREDEAVRDVGKIFEWSGKARGRARLPGQGTRGARRTAGASSDLFGQSGLSA